MRLIDELQAEHALIEVAVGSLQTFVGQLRHGEVDPADGPRFVQFLRTYAGHYHHAREEETLFVALVERAQLPHSGPIATLATDHREIAALLDRIDALITLTTLDETSGRELERLAIAYSHALWRHIDAENSVLFPESAARLRKAGVPELPSRPMTDDEAAARARGDALIARYAPTDDPTALRGDGCVCCPAVDDGCRGLELEWWNEWEWAEVDDHIASG